MSLAMKQLEGIIRRTIQTYNLIQAGDKVCVGVSGGKDSMALLLALHNLTKYSEQPFSIHALILDPCFGGKATNYAPLQAFFLQHGIAYTIHKTNIGQVVFDIRKESNPCALCANLRRGTLHTQAKILGCNKVALGHHMDDAVETFFMNLFNEGRIGCFAPKTYLSRKNIYVIRPLALALEKQVLAAVQAQGIPVVKSSCPADKTTQRQAAKQFVAQRSLQDPAFKQKTLGAMQKAGINGWGL